MDARGFSACTPHDHNHSHNDTTPPSPMGGVARRRRERRLRFDAPARTAVHPHGPGNGDAPLVQGAHRVRRSTEPDHSHQGQRGRGPRAALRRTGIGAISPGDAASTADGGAAAGAGAAAHCGAEDRAHALRADPRRSCR